MAKSQVLLTLKIKKMENNYSYIDAYNELQNIVAEIETGEANVDELAAKIKRAAELITICKAKLTASEEEVNHLIQQLTQEEGEPNHEEE